ncbi:GMC oxidoreductase-domain-containing protein [Biscogniauxia mediterranea]|nr:GMC oxidoreductase-domain-containing protein [Biscogniauxia mediterranea]
MVSCSSSRLALWVALLIAAIDSSSLDFPRPPSHMRFIKRSSQVKQSYDYVVVGAGTAGLTVADRLSADGKCEDMPDFGAGINTIVDLPGVGQNFQDRPMMFLNIICLPVISTDNFEAIASKLETQDHAAQLPTGTDPTVIAATNLTPTRPSTCRPQRADEERRVRDAHRTPNTAFYNHVLSGSGSGSAGVLVALQPAEPGAPCASASWPRCWRFARRYYLLRDAAAGAGGARLRRRARRPARLPARENYRPPSFHPAGTCAMMPRELGGVVDEELKVYGVRGLRVVDASIMPVLPGANTCQTVYAVAEKATDPIKLDS